MNGADRRLLACRRVAFSGPLGGVLELATVAKPTGVRPAGPASPDPASHVSAFRFLLPFLLLPAPVSYSLLLIVFYFYFRHTRCAP